MEKEQKKSDLLNPKSFNIEWNKVLLVWFWWFKNMWDELILLWNIKLLQQLWKKIFVVSQDNKRLKEFLSKEIDCSDITFLDELPRWFRSTFRYIKKNGFSQIKDFWNIDTVILWWGEILTEESPHSYYYWFWSIWPSLILRRNLYIMWGVQVPKKKINKILFNWILKRTNKIYCRDFEWVSELKKYWFNNAEFFMDTSYFVRDNRKKYLIKNDKKYIIININKNGKQFMDDLKKEIKVYLDKWYECYFVPVCDGWTDDDNRFFPEIKKEFQSIEILKWNDNFDKFLQFLWWADIVISARLHLYLISEYIWLKTKVFPYQKKINKMQEVIKKIN